MTQKSAKAYVCEKCAVGFKKGMEEAKVKAREARAKEDEEERAEDVRMRAEGEWPMGN